MKFCPTCANQLVITADAAGRQQFACATCPYVRHIEKQYSNKIVFERKKVDDVLGGQGAWDNVDATEATCPKCSNQRAYFMQIQIRSADEPMSTFYKCTQCGAQWREG